jgi:hypothetical protein
MPSRSPPTAAGSPPGMKTVRWLFENWPGAEQILAGVPAQGVFCLAFSPNGASPPGGDRGSTLTLWEASGLGPQGGDLQDLGAASAVEIAGRPGRDGAPPSVAVASPSRPSARLATVEESPRQRSFLEF